MLIAAIVFPIYSITGAQPILVTVSGGRQHITFHSALAHYYVLLCIKRFTLPQQLAGYQAGPLLYTCPSNIVAGD